MFSPKGLECPRGPLPGWWFVSISKDPGKRKNLSLSTGEHRGKNHCFQLSVHSEICCEISKCGAAGGGEAALSQRKVKENHSRSKNQEGTRRGHWFCWKPRGVWPDEEEHVVKVRESERRGLKVKSSHMPLA